MVIPWTRFLNTLDYLFVAPDGSQKVNTVLQCEPMTQDEISSIEQTGWKLKSVIKYRRKYHYEIYVRNHPSNVSIQRID